MFEVGSTPTEVAEAIEAARVHYNESMAVLGVPEVDAEKWHRICSEPLEDVKAAFARLRAHGPNGRKTIFTGGPVGWIDGGPIDE